MNEDITIEETITAIEAAFCKQIEPDWTDIFSRMKPQGSFPKTIGALKGLAGELYLQQTLSWLSEQTPELRITYPKPDRSAICFKSLAATEIFDPNTLMNAEIDCIACVNGYFFCFEARTSPYGNNTRMRWHRSLGEHSLGIKTRFVEKAFKVRKPYWAILVPECVYDKTNILKIFRQWKEAGRIILPMYCDAKTFEEDVKKQATRQGIRFYT